MKQIQITDPELLAHLRAEKTADVVDADGKVVGRVVFQKMTYPELNITDDELAAIENDPNAEWVSRRPSSGTLPEPTPAGVVIVPGHLLRKAYDTADQAFLAADHATQLRFLGVIDGINRALAQSPNDLGESREAGVRLAFFEFLAVRFQIDDAARTVRVTRVQRYGR